LRESSGNLAKFAAILLASSFVSNFAADRRYVENGEGGFTSDLSTSVFSSFSTSFLAFLITFFASFLTSFFLCFDFFPFLAIASSRAAANDFNNNFQR